MKNMVNRNDFYQHLSHDSISESEGHLNNAEIEDKIARVDCLSPLISPICTNRRDWPVNVSTIHVNERKLIADHHGWGTVSLVSIF